MDTVPLSPDPVLVTIPPPAQKPLIHIYTRHSKKCPHRGDEGWKRCTCLKWVRWRENGELRREPTKSQNWAGAERYKDKIEAAFDAAQQGQPAPNMPITVEQAITMFVAKKASKAKGTQAKYRQTLDRLLDFCNQESRYYITAVTESDMQKFRASFTGTPFTRRNHQERLRGFFRFCCASNEIRLSYNPTAQLEAVDLSAEKPTPPYSPKQYATVLATITKPEVGLTERQQVRIHGMIVVMREAGLAIQDAAILERDSIHKAKVRGTACYRVKLKRSKTGTPINNAIPKWAGDELLQIPNENNRYIFWSGNGQPKSAVTYWHKLFKKLFDATGIPDAIPHRFRDTFAVTLLEEGVPLRAVSQALGHKSEAVTQRHYADWSQKQQDQMDDYIASGWAKRKKSQASSKKPKSTPSSGATA
jgi:integrase/recombinase XerD